MEINWTTNFLKYSGVGAASRCVTANVDKYWWDNESSLYNTYNTNDKKFGKDAYKKVNRMKGFKIAKLKLGIELENEAIKAIVLLCGGDPEKAMHLFSG